MGDNKCLYCGCVLPEGKMVCKQCIDELSEESNFHTIKTRVLLNEISDIADFINIVSKCSCDVVAKRYHYAVNAKSMMGLMSLDLTNPIVVEFYGSIPNGVKEQLEKFIVN